MKKDKNDGFSIFVLSVLIIVLTFFLFFLIFKIITKKQAGLLTETVKLNYINEDDNQIAMSDSTAVDIYNSVFPNNANSINISSSNADYNYYAKLYTDNLVNISDLYSYDDKASMALRKLDSSLIIKNNINGVDYNTFKIELLKQSYENIFGNNTFIQNNFSSLIYPNCNISDTDYICDNFVYDITNNNMYLISKYDGYEKNINNLYIYEKIIYFNSNALYFAKDINGINKVTELNDIAQSTTIDNLATIDLDNYYRRYRHTFEIDNDNYTWVSTEPVN